MPSRSTAVAAAAVTLALWPGLAAAHPGHWAPSAGHDHWIALGVLGALGLAGLAARAKERRRRRREEDEDSDEAAAGDGDEAEA